MAIAVMNRARVEWAPAITGAFCTLAVAIVLGFFGAAFGQGGLRVLSGVWQVVTPLVATFIGAAIAASMAHRAHSFPTGLMVWCISLVSGLSLMASRAPTEARDVAGDGTLLALAGLGAILGLIGAVVGSFVGASLAARRAVSAAAAGREEYSAGTVPADTRSGIRPPASESDQPQLRH